MMTWHIAQHCTLYRVHCTLYIVHCTLYTVHCTLYTVHCTLYTVYVILQFVNFLVHTVNANFTLYDVNCKLCCTLYTIMRNFQCCKRSLSCSPCVWWPSIGGGGGGGTRWQNTLFSCFFLHWKKKKLHLSVGQNFLVPKYFSMFFNHPVVFLGFLSCLKLELNKETE